MATITASLERSLQNCSLNQGSEVSSGGGSLFSSSSGSSMSYQHHNNNKNEGVTESSASSSDDNPTFVDLNSTLPLPYHWEQCLDLKTGELYYINWRSGAKAKEDPRTTETGYNGDYYTEEEEEDDDDDEDEDEEEEGSPYDTESTSNESSACSSTRVSFRSVKKGVVRHQQVSQDSVLVVAGCKSCLMYYMVPKHVDECPKCSGQLLHFAANNSCP